MIMGEFCDALDRVPANHPLRAVQRGKYFTSSFSAPATRPRLVAGESFAPVLETANLFRRICAVRASNHGHGSSITARLRRVRARPSSSAQSRPPRQLCGNARRRGSRARLRPHPLQPSPGTDLCPFSVARAPWSGRWSGSMALRSCCRGGSFFSSICMCARRPFFPPNRGHVVDPRRPPTVRD